MFCDVCPVPKVAFFDMPPKGECEGRIRLSRLLGRPRDHNRALLPKRFLICALFHVELKRPFALT
jgi:hypothetical protein